MQRNVLLIFNCVHNILSDDIIFGMGFSNKTNFPSEKRASKKWLL